MKEILFTGAGGQGVLSAGNIVSEIAYSKGYEATWLPVYGSAMRGGTANCTVKFDEEAVTNPAQESPDVVLCLSKPAFRQYANAPKEGGILLINSDNLTDEELATVREDIKIMKIPARTLAESVGASRGINIVMTGAISKLTGEITMEEGLKGMNDMFRRKGKEKFEEVNTKAFIAGYEYFD